MTVVNEPDLVTDKLSTEQDDIADTHWSFVMNMARHLLEALQEAAPKYEAWDFCECEKTSRHTLLLSSTIVAVVSATLERKLNPMIQTKHGEMAESALVKSTGSNETDDAVVEWVQYTLPGSDEVVHRSVHATMKQGLVSQVIGGL